jgi:hypothetical protein
VLKCFTRSEAKFVLPVPPLPVIAIVGTLSLRNTV